MVEQVPTKEASDGVAHGEMPNNDNKRYKGVPNLLKGVVFTITRDGPDSYLKALKWLGVYVCATYKNGSDIEMCLEAEELLLLEELVLPENPTPHQSKM